MLALAVGGLAGCGATPVSLRNLDRGCAQGSGVSCVRLGVAWYEGHDEAGGRIDLDYPRARRAFEAGCQQGSAECCSQLGYMLGKGEGGPIDKLRGLDLSRRGCELGERTACRRTAESYLEGSVTIKCQELAFAYAKLGCDRDDKASCVLFKQLGGKPSLLAGQASATGSDLVGLIQACEQQNEARSCFAVGERFDKGMGTEVNKDKAAASYRLACTKGDMRGCHNLGIMMINAEGIPADRPGGLMLLNKACDSGQRQSCDQMVKLLGMLCGRNDGDACTILGRIYIKGDKGLETNVTKGIEHLRRGCSAGDKDGCDDLRKLGL